MSEYKLLKNSIFPNLQCLILTAIEFTPLLQLNKLLFKNITSLGCTHQCIYKNTENKENNILCECFPNLKTLAFLKAAENREPMQRQSKTIIPLNVETLQIDDPIVLNNIMFKNIEQSQTTTIQIEIQSWNDGLSILLPLIPHFLKLTALDINFNFDFLQNISNCEQTIFLQLGKIMATKKISVCFSNKDSDCTRNQYETLIKHILESKKAQKLIENIPQCICKENMGKLFF